MLEKNKNDSVLNLYDFFKKCILNKCKLGSEFKLLKLLPQKKPLDLKVVTSVRSN